MKKWIFLFSILLFQSFSGQQVDFLKIKNFRVAVLNDSIKETSGLNFFAGKLLTINDSGNTSEIFEIDKTSGKLQNIFKTNLINKDWEAIASDSTNIYVGDFGNNTGTRKDLKIYKISVESDNNAINLKTESIQTISYYYPNQKDFTSKNINNDFDAEAMIYLDGKIHVFTKEWASKAVSHYTLDPKITENQPAQFIEKYKTDFVVTDAAYYDKKLYLVGYTKNTEVYLSIFNETKPSEFFQEKSKKYYLGSALSVGQIEGVEVDAENVYISGEEFKTPLGRAAQSFYIIPKTEIK